MLAWDPTQKGDGARSSVGSQKDHNKEKWGTNSPTGLHYLTPSPLGWPGETPPQMTGFPVITQTRHLTPHHLVSSTSPFCGLEGKRDPAQAGF